MRSRIRRQAVPPTPLLPLHFTQGGVTRTQVLAIIRAHLRRSIFIAFVFICVAAIVIKLLPKSYTAQTTVIVTSLGAWCWFRL